MQIATCQIPTSALCYGSCFLSSKRQTSMPQCLWMCHSLLWNALPHPFFLPEKKKIIVQHQVQMLLSCEVSPDFPRKSCFSIQQELGTTFKGSLNQTSLTRGVQEGNPHVSSNYLWVPAEQIWRKSWSPLLQIKKFNHPLSELHCLTLKCLNMRAFVFSKLHSLWKPPPNIWQEAQQR